jgi:glycosyltransferase involved in cell wall biosynthesis
MNIAIDAREAAGRPTGVGRYLANLLSAWGRATSPAQHGFTLYGDERSARVFSTPVRDFPVSRLRRWPELIPGRDTLWQQITLPRQLRRRPPDVFFSPAYSLPYRLPCPAVVAVHDISFEAHPEWFPRRQAMRRKYTCRRACGLARLVLTCSEFSRSELISRYRLPPELVVSVPLAADPRFRPEENPAAELRLRREHGIRGRIILHAGTILNRRMIPLLLEAFAQVLKADPGLTLVFAGENRSWPAIDLFSLAAAFGVEDRIAVPGYVSDRDLAALYNASALTVYLSEYEGFGLPPLEALASGCPVVTSDNKALKEHFHGLARLHHGREPGALAQTILDVLALSADEPWSARLARSRLAADRFSWDRTADQTLSLIHRAAGGGEQER